MRWEVKTCDGRVQKQKHNKGRSRSILGKHSNNVKCRLRKAAGIKRERERERERDRERKT